jgi:hypothetical protein
MFLLNNDQNKQRNRIQFSPPKLFIKGSKNKSMHVVKLCSSTSLFVIMLLGIS